MCAHICVPDREGSWVFATTSLVVLWIAMQLAAYSDYLTTFYEPLLALLRCHASLKDAECDRSGTDE